MEEIVKLVESTKLSFPHLEYDIEAIKMAFLEDLEYGYDEDYILGQIKIEINNLIKLNENSIHK